jgi:hypothetical protein
MEETDSSEIKGRHVAENHNLNITMTNAVEQSVLEKLTVAQLVMKFPTFYGSADKILRTHPDLHYLNSVCTLIFKSHFNIILSASISLVSHKFYTPRPFHCPSFYHYNNKVLNVCLVK